jgi:hypothetical protein
MENKPIVCIPSKNRPSTKTYQLFLDAGFEVYHFIEPQELELYDVPNKVSIELNDQGIGYVRNYVLNHARKNNWQWIIVCDDDVVSFGIYNGKTVKQDANIWYEIFDKVKDLPYEIVGINYTQHSWHEKTPVSINRKFAEVCVLLHVSNIDWDYRPQFNLKEDRDFALQTIKYGYGVYRFNHYWFSCPDVGTNSGGLQDMYKQKKDELAAKKMSLEWAPFIKIGKKKTRIDMKTDIKALAAYHNKQVL